MVNLGIVFVCTYLEPGVDPGSRTRTSPMAVLVDGQNTILGNDYSIMLAL